MATQNIEERCSTASIKLIDWHCHILPGIDDGAKNIAEALEMARILSGAGFSEVYCTPHCMRGVYDNRPHNVRRAVVELQVAIDGAGIPLKLNPGMEYYLDEFFSQQLSDSLPLGDSGYLLVEAPIRADPDQIKDYLFAIRRRGFTPLLAHPERYEFLGSLSAVQTKGLLSRLKSRFQSSQPLATADLAEEILAMGCFFQGNLGSFAGIYGSEVKREAERYLAVGSYLCFGSDAHNAGNLLRILDKGLVATGCSFF